MFRQTVTTNKNSLFGKVSSILFIGVEQTPLDEPDVVNGDACSVSHDYPMTCAIQFSNITGDRRIAASGFFVVWNEIGDGDIRLFLVLSHENVFFFKMCFFQNMLDKKR